MADNVAVTAGSGTTIAADEVVDGTLGTVKVQYVKIMDATLDGTTKAAVGANGLKTDPTSALATNTGTRSASTVRVTVATDDLVPVKTASGAIASGSIASGAVASGAYAAGSLAAGAGVDGWDLTQGAIADAAVAAGATGSISAKLRSISRDIVANIVLAAGTNLIGLFKISDGTNTATVKAASTAPVTATDAAVVTVLRPDSAGIITTGTAGAASATVLTMQGVASMTPVQEVGYQVTCTTSITRPADTNAYTANDVWADSTSAPTSGGFTLTGAGRASGGSGMVTDIMFTSSAVPGTLLQAELHIFNQAATAVNDNAAWNLSDADALNRIGIVPFTMLADANNSYFHAQNLNIGFTCSGSANLRYLVKVKNAYTPVSAEVLTVTAKTIQVT